MGNKSFLMKHNNQEGLPEIKNALKLQQVLLVVMATRIFIVCALVLIAFYDGR